MNAVSVSQSAIEALSSRVAASKYIALPSTTATHSMPQKPSPDPFSALFYTKLTKKTPDLAKKSPIINRGTYARYFIVELVVRQFLECYITRTNDSSVCKACQIVCLGAGFDSLGLRLLSEEISGLSFFEVDLPELAATKASLLLSSSLLVSPRTREPYDITELPDGMKVQGWRLLGQDISNSIELVSCLERSGFQRNQPTLFLTECVFVYLHQQHTESIIQHLSSSCSDAVWVSYDMVSPEDVFGRNMVRNISAAGYQLYGFLAYPSLESQINRFLNYGWEAKSCTMLNAFEKLVPQEEKRRIQKIEMLDELEEWRLLMNHYSLSIAVKGELSKFLTLIE